MAFGSRMRMTVGDLQIELSPLTRESMIDAVEGMQQYSVTKYLRLGLAPTLEDEYEWYDMVRKDSKRMVWGIWVVSGTERKIIGNTAIFDIVRSHIHSGVSGSVIFDSSYWGRGIASAIHKARTWYAFQHMGLHAINSQVLHGNVASRRALEKTGYEFHSLKRNESYIDGEMRHLDTLVIVNPIDEFWNQWWHGDSVPASAFEAKAKAEASLAWAQANVEFS